MSSYVMSSTPSAGEIVRYVPLNIDGICGNHGLKERLRKRLTLNGSHAPLLIHGPRGTGKSSAMRWYGRLICCEKPNVATSEYCGECAGCLNQFSRHPHHPDVFQLLSYRGDYWYPYDCGNPRSDKPDLSVWDKRSSDAVHVYWFDQAERMSSELVSVCSHAIQDDPDAIFVFTTSSPEKIDDGLKCRLAERVGTELPQKAELTDWLELRCNEWSIERDESDVLGLLAGLSRQNVYACLQTLAIAAGTEDRRLTRDLVRSRQSQYDEFFTVRMR